jgi:hypothetical protein
MFKLFSFLLKWIEVSVWILMFVVEIGGLGVFDYSRLRQTFNVCYPNCHNSNKKKDLT